jgi:hypothetical protein
MGIAGEREPRAPTRKGTWRTTRAFLSYDLHNTMKHAYQIPSSSFTSSGLSRSARESSETSLPFLMTKTR